MNRPRYPSRSGQSLVEFAVIALVLYMLLAAILTFGHALYVAQGLQGAADLAAREISRTPLPAITTLEDALQSTAVVEQIYDPGLLVFDRRDLAPGESFFEDEVPTWPLLNQQLSTLMISDGDFIRYPGALLSDSNAPTGFTVGIPLVVNSDGLETIRWVPVVEEIESDASPDPFSVDSNQQGVVALRINYPFQSASMSSFRPNPAGPVEPSLGTPVTADDTGVNELNPEDRPGEFVTQPLVVDNTYAGTYGGQYGLGAQGAFGQSVRPFRRVISAQAIFRREVFSSE